MCHMPHPTAGPPKSKRDGMCPALLVLGNFEPLKVRDASNPLGLGCQLGMCTACRTPHHPVLILARGALIAMKCGMYEFWLGEGKAGIWVEHTGDMNHQVHIQHAHSICIACIVGYQCYPKAFHNLYRHAQNTNGAP